MYGFEGAGQRAGCIGVAIGLFLGGLPASLSAEPENRELIVLLPPESDPVAVAESINIPSPLRPIPYGLHTASPSSAELLIRERPDGPTLSWVSTHPDRPLSRLYRYLVVTYPDGTDVSSVRSTLEGIGDLEHVEPNLTFELQAAVLPDDPLLGSPGGSVTSSQWGTHVMRLPEAWEWSKGHTPIGFLDTGVDLGHEELRTWRPNGGLQALNGGNVREHLSYNQRLRTCNFSETTIDPLKAGHGSHTAGIAAAATDNSNGVSGACWNCPVEMQLTFGRNEDGAITTAFDFAARGLKAVTEQGAPVVNMSFAASGFYSCSGGFFGAFCTALSLAEERDQVLVVSAGNNNMTLGFPATDPRTLAIGGAEQDLDSPLGFARWYDCSPPRIVAYCGSNFGAELDLIAPAKDILSSVFKGLDHLPVICGDSTAGAPGDGYGLCTGTSMSAPYVAGLVGLVRSVQPLLNREQVHDVLISSASHFGAFSPQLGYGMPSADAAVKKALGSVRGQTLNNRLTPLFSLYSASAGAHIYTPWPTEVLAYFFDPAEPFVGEGPLAPGYPAFPGYEVCTISPCPVTTPRSSFSLFTTDRVLPGLPPLVPLYRVRFDRNTYWRCQPTPPPNVPGISFAYTTTLEGIEYFKNNVLARVEPDNPANMTRIGYDLDGILGYIFPRCSPEPECMPQGTTRLRRLYHPGKDDYIVAPDQETSYWLSQGYTETTTLATVLGYVYPNTDTDLDGLIDGYEDLLGTHKTVYDTDCDGIGDGAEILRYDSALHGYRDPLEGPCGYFYADGFETGDTTRWSATTFLDDGVGF